MPRHPSYPPGFTHMLASDIFATMLEMGRMPRGVSYRQATFLTSLTVRPSLTRADYQVLSHISANTAQLDIAELLAAGLIVPPRRRPQLALLPRGSPPPHPHATAPLSPPSRRSIAIGSPRGRGSIASRSPRNPCGIATIRA